MYIPRRMIELLIMLHSPAKYILIDEPFNGLSPLYIEEIKRMIKTQSINKGFIITDHSYLNILDIADTIFLLNEGALHKVNDKDELKWRGYIP